MKAITIEQIEQKIVECKDLPRKLRHWEVKKAEYEKKMAKEAKL